MPLRWKSDLNKVVITSNLEHRGWKPAEDDDWDIYWASVSTAQQIFAANSLVKLRPNQLINHFPNHFELTHKDLLVKNINRYRRRMRTAGLATPHIIPATFVLPQDYALFVEEFKKQPGSSTFILKPASKAQGKGIFLVNKLSQVRQHTGAAGGATGGVGKASVPAMFLPSGNVSNRPSSASEKSRPALEDYVVSRYISNPLLVLGGNKFDLRLYVLVPSFQPLVVYLSSLGFARFTNVRYTREVAELDNLYVHLTNVAVQKEGGSAYNSNHGNKWPLQDLRLHLEATRGHDATAQLFEDIQALVVYTLKAVQPVIINDKHCFELYGFDVIIDESLQPWLIEVNASPSMTTTTPPDRLLKWSVVHDALSIVVPQTPQPTSSCAGMQKSAALRPSSSPSSRQNSPSKHDRIAQQPQLPQYAHAVGCMQLIHHDGLEVTGKCRQPGKAASLKPGNAVDAAPSSGMAAYRKHTILQG